MNLKFDEMTVDTTLAQEFLRNENNNITLLTSQKCKGFDGDEFYDEILEGALDNGCSSSKLRQLAVLIKENTDLFAQLEYSIQKIPIEDTKKLINIIVQQLYYVSSCFDDTSPPPRNQKIQTTIYFYNKSSVLCLGLIARIMERNVMCPFIFADSKTVAITYLFSKLCCKAGIRLLMLLVTEYKEDLYVSDASFDGCVGVISENSDVDSAVDVFLSSTACQQVPWHLKKLLVQESVYQQFKDALTWKCNLNKQGDARTSETSTSDILEYNGRSFLIDSISVTDPQLDQVTVEAYRTKKELVTMLNEKRFRFLSLWANDIAEINEITHSILTRVTWVNNYGDFRGTPKISEVFYSHAFVFDIIKMANNDKLRELYKLQRSWLNLTIEARRVILYNTLSKYLAAKTIDQRDEKIYTDLKDLVNQLEVGICSGFVNVDKDYVCVGVPTHYDELFIWEFDYASVEFFKSILYGNAFALKSNCCPELINVFKNAGIPVIEMKNASREGDKKNIIRKFLEKTTVGLDQAYRVIWTNSGTIFAN